MNELGCPQLGRYKGSQAKAWSRSGIYLYLICATKAKRWVSTKQLSLSSKVYMPCKPLINDLRIPAVFDPYSTVCLHSWPNTRSLPASSPHRPYLSSTNSPWLVSRPSSAPTHDRNPKRSASAIHSPTSLTGRRLTFVLLSPNHSLTSANCSSFVNPLVQI